MKSFRGLVLTILMLIPILSYSQILNNDLIFNKPNQILDTIPSDFPKITVDVINNPSPGLIFLSSLGLGGTSKTTNYLMALDTLGKPVFVNKPAIAGIDFKMQTNGLFTYGMPIKQGDIFKAGNMNVTNAMVIEIIMDKPFNVVDNVQCKNGYLADTHEFKILPNGNYLMISYDRVPVDMSKIVTNGNPNAIMVQTIVQELDNKKNCVFQWRSIDNIPITDTHDNMQNAVFEHVHGNSIIQDYDGNLMISLATTFDVIKVDRVTGKTLWRLGGNKSDFNFIGEHQENAPDYFSLQHDLNRLNNGNLLFFDNGIARTDPYSRAVEYKLDEVNKTATLVWEYRNSPDIYSSAMGSAQRLSNGNTLIGWGLNYTGKYHTATEVRPDKTVAFDMSIPSDAYSYRVYKFPYPFCQAVADISLKDLIEGNTYKFKNTNVDAGVQMYIPKLSSLLKYNTVNVKKYECSPTNPIFNGENPVTFPGRYVVSNKLIDTIYAEIRFYTSLLPQISNPDSMKVFYRPTEGSGTFTPLPSHYDPTEKQIVANTSFMGEYVLGFYRSASELSAPILITPFDKKDLINGNPVVLNWTPKGSYNNFQLQVSSDSLFTLPLKTDLNNIVNTSQSVNLDSNKTYYWRVRTNYRNLISEWSSVRSINLSKPFMSISIPNGKEVWVKDTNLHIIRWNSNLNDSVSISLMKNGIKVATIKDSIYSYTNAYAWKIPVTILEDSTYKIEVKSIKNSNLNCLSLNTFAIKNPVVSVEDSYASNFKFDISPNPASDNINIALFNNADLLNERDIHLGICNSLGIEILESNIKDITIKNSIVISTKELASGIYYCTFTFGKNKISKSFAIVK